MPNLRDMIDNRTLSAAGIAPPIASPPPGNAMPMGNSKPPKNANQKNQAGGLTNKSTVTKNGKPGQNGKTANSPAAEHVLSHLGDPLGATKEGFTDLTQKKSDYDNARAEMQRELTMPQAVIDHVAQIHGLVPGGQPGQLPTPGMTPAQNNTGVDPATGMPLSADPNNPGQDPNNPGGNDNPDMDPMTGNPANMSQTMGRMNQNRPSMAGHQPGVSPGPSENVRPGKMGMPQPGGGLPQNNKQAAKPKGAGSMPGAKGPGDPKVAGKNNKAQGNSSRQVKISVAASSSSGLPVIHASRTIDTQFGLATLKAAGTSTGAKKNWSTRNKGHLSKTEKQAHYGTMDAVMMQRPPMGGGMGMRPGGGMMKPGGGGTGSPVRVSGPMRFKKIKAGPAQLSDKVSDSGAQLAYTSPEGSTTPKLNACSKCGKMHGKGMECSMFA